MDFPQRADNGPGQWLSSASRGLLCKQPGCCTWNVACNYWIPTELPEKWLPTLPHLDAESCLVRHICDRVHRELAADRHSHTFTGQDANPFAQQPGHRLLGHKPHLNLRAPPYNQEQFGCSPLPALAVAFCNEILQWTFKFCMSVLKADRWSSGNEKAVSCMAGAAY
jgi:hypothetical protein